MSIIISIGLHRSRCHCLSLSYHGSRHAIVIDIADIVIDVVAVIGSVKAMVRWKPRWKRRSTLLLLTTMLKKFSGATNNIRVSSTHSIITSQPSLTII